MKCIPSWTMRRHSKQTNGMHGRVFICLKNLPSIITCRYRAKSTLDMTSQRVNHLYELEMGYKHTLCLIIVFNRLPLYEHSISAC